ncbi:MAG: VCBS repeat-containing protein [Acidobacteria bacterium]|nr:VCBS repeat-containing protein [Acidobacteriota bacterium]
MRETKTNLQLFAVSLAILLGLILIGVPVSAQGQQAVAAPPANDNFANAQTLVMPSGSVAGTNLEATSETGEPNIVSGGTVNSVWYKLTAPFAGSLTIDTNGAGTLDATIGVFTGTTVDSLTKLADNDGYSPNNYSRLTVGTATGSVYYIKVDGFGANTGTFTLNYNLTPASSNDNFANALQLYAPLGVSRQMITDTNIGATGETGEPIHAGVSTPINSVWYKWTAPANLSMTFETKGSDYDTALAVYTGSAVNMLTQVAANDDLPVINQSRVTFIATAGTTYYLAVDGFGSHTGNILLSWRINESESGKQFSFETRFWTDFAVYRPGNNTWYIRQSIGSGASIHAYKWGQSGDVLVPGDFDGDDMTDVAVFRPSNNTFYARGSSTGGVIAAQWGASGDVPVQGDFDGDNRADFAVWRPSNATFYVRQSSSGTLLAVQWGQSGTDVPVTGDYDGDGKADFAVFRKSAGTGAFYIRRSSDGTLLAQQWGTDTDQVVPGDYDKDGKRDIAVWRPSNGTFYVLRSSDGALHAQAWGQNGDIVSPGDYDADGKTDFTVYRPSESNFYVLKSSTGTLRLESWGASGDLSVSNTNVH